MPKVFLALLILAVTVRVVLAFSFPLRLKDGEQVYFETTLLSEPSNHGGYQTMQVSLANGWTSQRMTLIVPPTSDLHYGQTITVSGKIEIKQVANGVMIMLYHPHIAILKEKQNPLLAISYWFRQKIAAQYSAALPPASSALLLGIVLGVKGNFAQNFLANLQATGVMHVIAASGMNVTMVAGFLLGLFTTLFKRQWAVALTMLGLLLYCIISGLQASILRATIMLVFALSAQLFGRQYSGIYGLLLAAAGMLLYFPMWVLDIGFQLSFTATLGILFLKPVFPKWGIVSDDVGTTIAAQIATLPILVGSFGSYGLLSIAVNALVLWTIPPLMVLGGIGGLLGLLFAPLGNWLIILCEPLLWFFESVVNYFGNFHWLLAFSALPVSMIVGYYLMVGGVVLLTKRRGK